MFENSLAFCRRCEQPWPHGFFRIRKDTQKRDSVCRICQTERKRRQRDERRQFIYEYLLEHPCPCGESDPVVLEFDHTEFGNKVASISFLIKHAGMRALKDEMEKCQVLCANCHRRKTAKDFGHYRERQKK